MEACFEYLGCDERECIMHARKDGPRCWEVEGTLCNHVGIQLVRDFLTAKKKEDACAFSCIYYQAAKSRSLVGSADGED